MPFSFAFFQGKQLCRFHFLLSGEATVPFSFAFRSGEAKDQFHLLSFSKKFSSYRKFLPSLGNVAFPKRSSLKGNYLHL